MSPPVSINPSTVNKTTGNAMNTSSSSPADSRQQIETSNPTPESSRLYTSKPNDRAMTTLPKTPSKTKALNAFEESVFRANRPLLNNEAFTPLKATLLEHYHALGFPTRKLEAWKTIPIKTLGQQAVQPAMAPTPQQLAEAQQLLNSEQTLPAEQSLTLTFVNGFFAQELSAHLTHLPTGLSVSHWQKNAPNSTVLSTDAIASTEAIERLNLATLSDGLTLQIHNEATIHPTINIVLIETADIERLQYSASRVVIDAKANSQAHLVFQTLTTKQSTPTLGNHSLLINAEANAFVDVVMVQETTESHWNFSAVTTNINNHATVALTTNAFGTGISRHNLVANINGAHAHVTHNGVSVLKQHGQMFTHSIIHHNVPETTSSQHVKALLNDASKNEFNATIHVAKNAQLTDATQLNNNLLLSDKARAYSRPQLNIYADDVKCNHGATMGQLDDEALFYLNSRGLSIELAHCLLTFGFASETFKAVKQPLTLQWLNLRLMAAMDQKESPLDCMLDCTTCSTHGAPF